jgi:replication factor C large subunit
MRYSRNNLLEVYSKFVKNEKSAVEITAALGLELEELIYLSGSSKPNKKLQKIYDEAQELLLEGIEKAEEAEFFKNPVSAENNKQESSKQVNSLYAVKTSDRNTSDNNRKKAADGSEIPGSGFSERKQKNLNSSFDISSEVPGEEEVLEGNTSDLPGSNISGSDSLISVSFTPASLTSDASTSVPDSPESLEKKVLDLSASPERQVLPESDNLSESFENQAILSPDLVGSQRVSSAPPKQRTLTNCEPVDNESINSAPVDNEPLNYEPIKNDPINNGHVSSGSIVTQDSESKSADPGAETAEIPKKTESKNQRTIFDF